MLQSFNNFAVSYILQDLSHNNLSDLPVGMGYMVRLITLNLCHNVIRELPPDMMSMRCKFHA